MSDREFLDLLIYSLLFVGAIAILVIIGYIMRSWSRSRLKDDNLLFGGSIQEIDKLKREGLLTPEEAKRVREAMVKQLRERMEEEEQAKKSTMGTNAYLAIVEEQAKVMREKGEIPAPIQPPVSNLEIPVKSADLPQLPAHLRLLATKDAAELDMLVEEDYLKPEDREILRQWQEARQHKSGGNG